LQSLANRHGAAEAGGVKSRRKWQSSSSRALLLLGVGLGLGTLAALTVVDQIRDARNSGLFGARVPVQAEDPAPPKPTEEESLMAHAVAAAIGARTFEDCRTLAPRHRQACRAYVEQLALNPPPVAQPRGQARTDAPAPLIAPEAPSR
jgi:hypothetical protein